ncbi:unnamed protein product [Durusdinium trenchii]|uniref:Uncharacterized protein n=2 Tax=Durusdinium trenchii TaxID=1381693 RepID=A0ABP0RUM2_9DINO
MLRLCSAVSGAELASLTWPEGSEHLASCSVKSLKKLSAPQVGLSRFRQQWFNEDLTELHDEDVLELPATIQLVVRTSLPLDDWSSQKLVLACAANDAEELERLLLLPACPEATDHTGKPALRVAVEAGHCKCVGLLLEARAVIDQEGDFGSTLLLAACGGNLEVVQLLLESGAKTGLGATALHGAACYGHIEVVRFFLDKGTHPDDCTSDITTLREHSRTPLGFSLYLASRGGTALHLAAVMGHWKVVHLLLQAGADRDKIISLTGESALHLAASNGHVQVVRLLLEAQADANRVEGCGVTALHWASLKGYLDIVDALIEALCDVNHVRGEKTALHWAAEHGHMAVARRLLKAGAQIDETMPINGASALHLAADHGHSEVLQLLLEARAHKDHVTQSGATALDWATERNHEKVIQLLIQAGAKRSTREVAAVVQLVNEQLASKQSEAATALHLATQNGQLDYLHLLHRSLACDCQFGQLFPNVKYKDGLISIIVCRYDNWHVYLSAFFLPCVSCC